MAAQTCGLVCCGWKVAWLYWDTMEQVLGPTMPGFNSPEAVPLWSLNLVISVIDDKSWERKSRVRTVCPDTMYDACMLCTTTICIDTYMHTLCVVTRLSAS